MSVAVAGGAVPPAVAAAAAAATAASSLSMLGHVGLAPRGAQMSQARPWTTSVLAANSLSCANFHSLQPVLRSCFRPFKNHKRLKGLLLSTCSAHVHPHRTTPRCRTQCRTVEVEKISRHRMRRGSLLAYLAFSALASALARERIVFRAS